MRAVDPTRTKVSRAHTDVGLGHTVRPGRRGVGTEAERAQIQDAARPPQDFMQDRLYLLWIERTQMRRVTTLREAAAPIVSESSGATPQVAPLSKRRE